MIQRSNRSGASYVGALATLLLLLLLALPAHAYLDPGTGSFIIQGLLALAFGIAFTLRRSWWAVIRGFKKSLATLTGRESNPDASDDRND